MPKNNPKRKTKYLRQAKNTLTASSSAPSKKEKSYTKKSLSPNKFYAIIIIAAVVAGIAFLAMNFSGDVPEGVEQGDHVRLHLKIWIQDPGVAWNESTTPDNESTQWYNFTTIYNPSTDSNITVKTEGLPVGIYTRVKGQSVGFNYPVWIENCIDLDKDGKDDYDTKRDAKGWGFPSTHPFYNKTIVVRIQILDLHKLVKEETSS